MVFVAEFLEHAHVIWFWIPDFVSPCPATFSLPLILPPTVPRQLIGLTDILRQQELQEVFLIFCANRVGVARVQMREVDAVFEVDFAGLQHVWYGSLGELDLLVEIWGVGWSCQVMVLRCHSACILQFCWARGARENTWVTELAILAAAYVLLRCWVAEIYFGDCGLIVGGLEHWRGSIVEPLNFVLKIK